MRIIDGSRAMSNLDGNKYAYWNHVSGSDQRSPRKGDASNRTFDGAADVKAKYSRPKLKRSDPVFAMGSCFARELEARLLQVGGAVCSVDERLRGPEFLAPDGSPTPGVLHRYTPQSMLQELRAAFGEQPGWSEEVLIFERSSGLSGLLGAGVQIQDGNYNSLTYADTSRRACMSRRRIAQALVRRVSEARLVLMTLGVNEAWFHRPTGLYVNRLSSGMLEAHKADLELHIASAAEVEATLEAIYAFLKAKLQPGFDFVVTASPQSIAATFQATDVIVADAEAKAILRAAAGGFAAGKKDVHYFPSFEITRYSDTNLVWRPDRIHVMSKVVRRIVDNFTDTYYEPGAFPPRGQRGGAAETGSDEA